VDVVSSWLNPVFLCLFYTKGRDFELTQLENAKKNIITNEMKRIAKDEHIDVEVLRNLIAEGKIVIPKNKKRNFKKVIGIGEKLRTKVNANLGTSKDYCNLEEEIEKLKVAIETGTDTIMDLSTGGKLRLIRKKMLEHSPVPVGTVPIYQIAVELMDNNKSISEMDEKHILKIIQQQAEDGVDFFTIHSGLTKPAVEKMDRQKRLMNVVSRGGSIITDWIRKNKKENPFYTLYDEILDIMKEYDITISLGDGLRPGCINDSTDYLQVHELMVLGELRDRAIDKGVQVMIEGPGHIPLGEIMTNVQLEKKICKGAPFYVLGPIVTDVAPGYDHIVSAIGGAIAGSCGADFLCFVTPSEHLRLPSIEDVREGVVAAKIAGHIADIEKGVYGAKQWDYEMSKCRSKLDWDGMLNLALEKTKPRKFREERLPTNKTVCTMCGELCSMLPRK